MSRKLFLMVWCVWVIHLRVSAGGDTILFENGDLILAELVDLQDGMAQLQTELDPEWLAVPQEKIRSWYHEVSVPPDPAPARDRIRLVNGQEFFGSVQSLDDKVMTLTAAWGQTLTLDRQSLLFWKPGAGSRMTGIQQKDWELHSYFPFKPDTTSEWQFRSGRATHPGPGGHGFRKEMDGLPTAFVLHSRLRFQGTPDAYRIQLDMLDQAGKPNWQILLSHGRQNLVVRDKKHLWGDLAVDLPEDILQSSVQEVMCFVDMEKGVVTLWVNGQKLQEVKAQYPADARESVQKVSYELKLNSAKPVVVEHQDLYADVSPLFEERGEGEGGFMVLENFDIQPLVINSYDGRALNARVKGFDLSLPLDRLRAVYFRHPVPQKPDPSSTVMLITPHPLLNLLEPTLKDGTLTGKLSGVSERVSIPLDWVQHIAFPTPPAKGEDPDLVRMEIKQQGHVHARLLRGTSEVLTYQPAWLDTSLDLAWNRISRVTAPFRPGTRTRDGWVRLQGGDVLAGTALSHQKGILNLKAVQGGTFSLPVGQIHTLVQLGQEAENWVYDVHQIAREKGLVAPEASGVTFSPTGGVKLPNGPRYFFPLPKEPVPYDVTLRLSTADDHYHAMIGLSAGPQMNPQDGGVRVLLDTRGVSVRVGGRIHRVQLSPEQFQAGLFRIQVDPQTSAVVLKAGEEVVFNQQLEGNPLNGLVPSVTLKKRGNGMILHEFQVLPKLMAPLETEWREGSPPPLPFAAENAEEKQGEVNEGFRVFLQDRLTCVNAHIRKLEEGTLLLRLRPSDVEGKIPVEELWILENLTEAEHEFAPGWHGLSVEAEESNVRRGLPHRGR